MEELTIDQDTEHPLDVVTFIVGRQSQLRMSEQRIKNPEVGVSKGGRLFRQVQQVSDQNVNQDMQIVRVEVFVGARSGEDQV